MVVSGVGAPQRRTLEATSPRYGEKIIKLLLLACAALSVAVTTAIVISLLLPAISFFQEVPVMEFLTGTQWAPSFATPSFGVLPIVVGTLMVVVIALSVAIPIGLASAIYMSEYAPHRVRKILKPVLEVLEGIPTVATGLFAFWFLRPLAEDLLPFLPWQGPFSIGVAGFAVGLLIVPLVASVSDDAMRSVPQGLRQGAYALGASKLKVSLRVVLPAAISGIIAAFVLGASRAIGETMVVLIAAGAGNPNLSFDPTQGIQTMTAFIGGRATGDIATGTLDYDTIFAVGLLLFLFTLGMNMLAIRMVHRFREVYE
ncbi:phosphate ABC transporter permease subunit PstC [Rhabdothermincola salaria]|uniref:phosphate ABC transporter permease subunit PstC n=1 Tax=Rhabdothermincola salaria TaxID=2903142 RepID=UPI0020182595|nr:phosphate ABC transporter permease subunit PstC [Rhabdothermincola salaria]